MERPAAPRPRSRRRLAPTDDDLPGRIAELEQRLAEVEEGGNLRKRGRSMMDRVVPVDAQRHFRNASREQLMGVRSLVDFWIKRLDAADAAAASGTPERERIEIS